MSLYATSVLAKAQVKGDKAWSSPETRAKQPTVMAMAIKNATTAISAAEIARVHENRVVDINFFSKIAAGSGTAKSAYHTGSVGDSAKQNLVYVTTVEKFSVPYKLADNNVFGYEEIFMNQWNQAWQNALARQDSAALTYLVTNRCKLTAANLATPIAASGAGTWNDTKKALEITAANKNLRIQKAQSFLKARYFNGFYDAVVDLQTAAELEFALNQGAGNNQNTAFQFGQTSFVPTPEIITAEYAAGGMIIMPKGTFAGIVWNDKQNLKGVNVGGREGLLTTAVDPFGYGVRADVSVYTERTDSSADTNGGSTQDFKDEVEITLTVAYAVAPLTTANDGVAHLVGITA